MLNLHLCECLQALLMRASRQRMDCLLTPITSLGARKMDRLCANLVSMSSNRHSPKANSIQNPQSGCVRATPFFQNNARKQITDRS
jgi:hypothetical protein